MTETTMMEQRAAKALKSFPLPAQSATSAENYQRVLEWLYHGRPNVASLVIDLEFPRFAERSEHD